MDNHHNLPTEKDDSHLRWDNQTDTDVFIWNYYDEIVAKKIIAQLIQKKDIKFADFYRQIALKRAECEWIKDYVRDQNIRDLSAEKIDSIAKSSLYTSFPAKFANFIDGGTTENNILKGGTTIETFLKK